jgi:hypothetical protein
MLDCFQLATFFFFWGRGDGDGVFPRIMIKMMKCSNAQEENKLWVFVLLCRKFHFLEKTPSPNPLLVFVGCSNRSLSLSLAFLVQ